MQNGILAGSYEVIVETQIQSCLLFVLPHKQEAAKLKLNSPCPLLHNAGLMCKTKQVLKLYSCPGNAAHILRMHSSITTMQG